ncbi:MAG: dihydrolipoyllysine-residue acetyltransferase [Comamonadaceae bacterium]|jgi:pyruvate dehydrogenase E2 component (dihydrolipoamide acetyltransferase)|nr:dihydrolipoyllysine-residue acetyltransferase [Comamonadaceae bacterium]
MALVDIKVPDIGDFDEVAVIELLVKPGDTVKAEQSLITVESDKASMEIPSSHAGVVRSLSVQIGDKVKQGSVIVVLQAQGADAAVAAPASPPQLPPSGGSVLPAPPARVNEGAGLVQVRVPNIGDFKDVAVIEVLVKPGDTVKVEQSLITVESDKASMEIPSSAAGVIQELKVKVGDKVNIGDLLALLAGSAATSAAAAATVPAAAAATVPVSAAAASIPSVVQAPSAAAAVAAAVHAPAAVTLGLPHASPSVRKFARELGVPLNEVKGSGLKGRITQEDVQAFTQSVMSGAVQTLAQAQTAKANTGAAGGAGSELGLIPWPKVDFAKFGPIERKEMSRIKKISGANLLRNAVMIPAVTNHDDADITELEAFRVATNKDNEKSGIKVTMLAFLIKASVAALKKFPEFNSSLDGDALIYKHYHHIGFAADTPSGLVVPVVRDADKKGILQISQEMADLAKKAREGKLSPADMSGATFTISSLGGIGGRYFTPIINAPEVAILGVCKSTMEPVWNGKEFVPRLMLPLSLTWDHRVIDGAAAARFNAYLGQILGDMRRVLL